MFKSCSSPCHQASQSWVFFFFLSFLPSHCCTEPTPQANSIVTTFKVSWSWQANSTQCLGQPTTAMPLHHFWHTIQLLRDFSHMSGLYHIPFILISLMSPWDFQDHGEKSLFLHTVFVTRKHRLIKGDQWRLTCSPCMPFHSLNLFPYFSNLSALPHRHYPSVPRKQDVCQPDHPDTDLGKPDCPQRGSSHDLAHPYLIRRDDHMDVDPPYSSRSSQYEEPARPRELGNCLSSHMDGCPRSPSVCNLTLCCKVRFFFLFLPSHLLTCGQVQDMSAQQLRRRQS